MFPHQDLIETLALVAIFVIAIYRLKLFIDGYKSPSLDTVVEKMMSRFEIQKIIAGFEIEKNNLEYEIGRADQAYSQSVQNSEPEVQQKSKADELKGLLFKREDIIEELRLLRRDLHEAKKIEEREKLLMEISR